MQTLARPIQFQKKHSDAFPTEASLRWLLFAKRPQLEAAGAIRKVGRRLYIVEEKFFEALSEEVTSGPREEIA